MSLKNHLGMKKRVQMCKMLVLHPSWSKSDVWPVVEHYANATDRLFNDFGRGGFLGIYRRNQLRQDKVRSASDNLMKYLHKTAFKFTTESMWSELQKSSILAMIN